MKNIFLLMVIVVFSSCSKDEATIPQDQLIGSWTKVQSRYEYQDGTVQTDNTNGCSLQNKIIFKMDGTFEELSYGLNLNTNDCTLQTNGFTGSKTWSKTNNGSYIFSKTSTNPNYDSSLRLAITAVFQANTVTFRFQETDIDPSDSNPVLYYNEVYQKN